MHKQSGMYLGIVERGACKLQKGRRCLTGAVFGFSPFSETYVLVKWGWGKRVGKEKAVFQL